MKKQTKLLPQGLAALSAPREPNPVVFRMPADLRDACETWGFERGHRLLSATLRAMLMNLLEIERSRAEVHAAVLAHPVKRASRRANVAATVRKAPKSALHGRKAKRGRKP